jgi:AcrR family transcriptional regulator
VTDATPNRRVRLLAQDWVLAAVAALAEGDLRGVAVEPLARGLGVTKGSFYHHFGDLDALIRALVGYWEEEGTDRVIERLDALTDPRERLRELVHVSWERLDHLRAEAALGAAAASGDARVAPVVARVTAKRLAYIERLYRALGHTPALAKRRALHALATYLGTVALAGAGALRDARALRSYMTHVESVLVPPPRRGRRP